MVQPPHRHESAEEVNEESTYMYIYSYIDSYNVHIILM